MLYNKYISMRGLRLFQSVQNTFANDNRKSVILGTPFALAMQRTPIDALEYFTLIRMPDFLEESKEVEFRFEENMKISNGWHD